MQAHGAPELATTTRAISALKKIGLKNLLFSSRIPLTSNLPIARGRFERNVRARLDEGASASALPTVEEEDEKEIMFDAPIAEEPIVEGTAAEQEQAPAEQEADDNYMPSFEDAGGDFNVTFDASVVEQNSIENEEAAAAAKMAVAPTTNDSFLSFAHDAATEEPLGEEEASILAAESSLPSAAPIANNADASFVTTVSLNEAAATEGSFSRNTAKTVSILRKLFDGERKAGHEEALAFSAVSKGVS